MQMIFVIKFKKYRKNNLTKFKLKLNKKKIGKENREKTKV